MRARSLRGRKGIQAAIPKKPWATSAAGRAGVAAVASIAILRLPAPKAVLKKMNEHPPGWQMTVLKG